MNRHLLGKILDVFPQNSKNFFLQILMIVLKIDITLNSFLARQLFNYSLNQLFLEIFFDPKSFYQLIKARGKYKQVIKFWITVDYHFLKTYKMMLLQITFVLCEDNYPFFFLYKDLLQFFALVSTTMSAGLRASGHVPSLSSKGYQKELQHFNLALTFFFNHSQGNSFIIKITS